jgi:26S proteasome regulatory subunit N10
VVLNFKLARVNLLVSPTEEIGKVLAAFALVKLDGKSTDLSTAVQIAQLALKHRKNKNGGQRIIAFVGGPLEGSVVLFQKVGKNLKKNNVAIDIVSMGEIDQNLEKLTELVGAANTNDNRFLVLYDKFNWVMLLLFC